MPPRSKPSRSRRFQRPSGSRPYRKIFHIAVEGAETERQYFAVVRTLRPTVQLNVLHTDQKSAPLNVLKRMKNHLKDNPVKFNDEAWIVSDRDEWDEEHLNRIQQWSRTNEKYGFAVSNPAFEYWLLLHFEGGKGVRNKRVCIERLRQHMPEYDKHIDTRRITLERIVDAIQRAKCRDNPPCDGWPRSCGATTVYKLIKNIIQD